VLASSTADVWDGAIAYPWRQTAGALNVAAGGNVNDTAAGSGANVILIQGLDADWLPIQEQLVLAGASASASTVKEFLRVQRVQAISGTWLGSNAGDIVVEQAGTTLAIVKAGNSYSQMGLFSVPATHTAQVVHTREDIESGKAVTVQFVAHLVGLALSPIVVANLVGAQESAMSPIEGAFFPPKTDVWARVITPTGGTVSVSVFFNLELKGPPLVYL